MTRDKIPPHNAVMSGQEISYVRAQLAKRTGKLPQLSRDVGISIKTIRRLASGFTKYGRADTIEKLANYFRRVS